MKDFLLVYNNISENCFNQCVTTFADRVTTNSEVGFNILKLFELKYLLLSDFFFFFTDQLLRNMCP